MLIIDTHALTYLPTQRWFSPDIGNFHMQVYFSCIQHKSYGIICSMKIVFFSWIDTQVSFKDHELVLLEIIWGESTTNL